MLSRQDIITIMQRQGFKVEERDGLGYFTKQMGRVHIDIDDNLQLPLDPCHIVTVRRWYAIGTQIIAQNEEARFWDVLKGEIPFLSPSRSL